ncbi:hypothetical protein NDA18_006291 [Ustilago nuda]|nr:hypothetical protein NDA18_006291 [Ustilago nuda]
MKFLPLLSAVLLSLAIVRADSPVAEQGKVPQLIELINKLENANPTSSAFLANYGSEIPELAKLHHEVAAQSREHSVRKLYGDDAAAQKLLGLVTAKAAEKREVKPKKEKKAKENNGKSAAHKKGTKNSKPVHPEHPAHPKTTKDSKKTTKGDVVNKHKQGQKQSSAHKSTHSAKPEHPKTHGDGVNKGKQGQKQSTAHKPVHAAHPEHLKKGSEKAKRDEQEDEVKPKKEGTKKEKALGHNKQGKKAPPAHPEHHAHPTKPKTHGDEMNKGKQGDKKKHTHTARPVKPTKKEHKKPAHKHKSKTAKTVEGTTTA